jgi:hypothetical protein
MVEKKKQQTGQTDKKLVVFRNSTLKDGADLNIIRTKFLGSGAFGEVYFAYN